jgi:hypothetical protein
MATKIKMAAKIKMVAKIKMASNGHFFLGNPRWRQN